MQWLASICVRRPVFATVLILTIVVVGILGYSRLNVDRFPNVDFPIVAVVTTLPGAVAARRSRPRSPTRSRRPINTISGIDELRSVSTEGVSQVFVSFQLDKDVNVAAQEVRDHVSHDPAGPARGDQEPGHQQARSRRGAGAVRRHRVAAARSARSPSCADHEIRQSLENVSGRRAGDDRRRAASGRSRWCSIRSELRSAGLSAVDVQRAIVGQNITAPGGAVDTGPAAPHLPGAAAGSPASRRWRTIIVRSVEGHPILVRDVAASSTARRRPRPRPASPASRRSCCSIRKQSGENSVARGGRPARAHEGDRADPAGRLRTSTSSATTPRPPAPASTRCKRAPHPGRHPGLAGRAALPRQRAQHDHRRAGHPDLDHRHVHVHVADGLHAQHHHPAGAGAGGRHRHRRRDRRAREHLPVHRREEGPADAGGDLRHQGDRPRGAWPPPCRCWRCSCRSRSCSSIPGRFLRSFGLTMAASIAISLFVSFTLTPMLASRWLRLRPRARPGAPQVRARAARRRLLPADRAPLHAGARVRHRPPLGRGARGGRGAGVRASRW